MENKESKKTPDKEQVIKIKGLKKSFGKKEVLRDVNMELARSENLVVLGRSGTGKSVTIKCIIGLLQQDAGTVHVFGKEVLNLKDKELKELRTKVGFLFQSAALYDSMSVRENLEFPLIRAIGMKNNEEISKRIEEVLNAVGLIEQIDAMPADLSGGMRKRIGLARTLILKPEIMLYDEPTTGLDPITSRGISELILKMQEKYQTSSIIITHDLSCAKITADRVLVLHEGVIVEAGTYEEVEQSGNELVQSFFKQ